MAASKWHKITNITDDDLAGSLDALTGHVFNECNLTLNGDTEVQTEPFDFVVNGDLTIVVNSNAAGIGTAYNGSNARLYVQGSVDTSSWFQMDELTLDAAGTPARDIEGKAYMHVYDYDGNGRAPFMRVALVGHGASANTLKIAVIPQ